MADERSWMSMDVPDFVREAEEAMARGETLGGSYTEVARVLWEIRLLPGTAKNWWKSVFRIRIRRIPVLGKPL